MSSGAVTLLASLGSRRSCLVFTRRAIRRERDNTEQTWMFHGGGGLAP
jgi:hypothetical protein